MEYASIKESISSLLQKLATKRVEYIYSHLEQYPPEYLGELLKEIEKGNHVDITQSLDHRARDLLSKSLVSKIEDKAVKKELLAYFTAQKPYTSINECKTVLDKILGERSRKELAIQLYKNLKREYIDKTGHDFLDRRLRNAPQMILSVLQELKDN